MAYAYPGGSALDYFPCRYGKSKLLFRGPRRDLSQPYCAVLGGTETYGKFVAEPFAVRVEAETGIRMVNLGCVNAGLDVFVGDPAILDIASQARVTVLQILGAQNMSNRFYTVHPRRNDRFVQGSSLLHKTYRDVDFTEFNFTRHMLHTLQTISPDKFETVANELRTAWVARMRQLLGMIDGKTVLMWVADHQPPEPGAPINLETDPMLIDAAMIRDVVSHATDYVEVVSSDAARQTGVEGMVFGPLDEAAATLLPNPAVHDEISAALAPVLQRMI